jgi:hypothetical protein
MRIDDGLNGVYEIGANRCLLAMVEPTQRRAKTIDSCKGMTFAISIRCCNPGRIKLL